MGFRGHKDSQLGKHVYVVHTMVLNNLYISNWHEKVKNQSGLPQVL